MAPFVPLQLLKQGKLATQRSPLPSSTPTSDSARQHRPQKIHAVKEHDKSYRPCIQIVQEASPLLKHHAQSISQIESSGSQKVQQSMYRCNTTDGPVDKVPPPSFQRLLDGVGRVRLRRTLSNKHQSLRSIDVATITPDKDENEKNISVPTPLVDEHLQSFSTNNIIEASYLDISQEDSCDNHKDTQISDDAPIEDATTLIISRDEHTHSSSTDDNNQDNSPTPLPDKRLQPSSAINITKKYSHDAQTSVICSPEDVSALIISAGGYTQWTSENYTVQDNVEAVETLVNDPCKDFVVTTPRANEQLPPPSIFEICQDNVHVDQSAAEVLLSICDQGSYSNTNVAVENTETAMDDLQPIHDHSSGSLEKDFPIDLDMPYLPNARWYETWDIEIFTSSAAPAAPNVSGAAAVHVSNEATSQDIMIAPIEKSARASSEPALSASCHGTLQSACMSSSQSCPASIPLDCNWDDSSSIDLPEIVWKCDTCLEYVLPSDVYTRLTCRHVSCTRCLSRIGASKDCYAC